MLTGRQRGEASKCSNWIVWTRWVPERESTSALQHPQGKNPGADTVRSCELDHQYGETRLRLEQSRNELGPGTRPCLDGRWAVRWHARPQGQFERECHKMVWEVDHFDGNGNRYVVRQGDIDAVAVVLAVSQGLARMDVSVLIRFLPATTIDSDSGVAG